MSDRIAAIRKMLDKTPGDTFLHYSLAMEFCASGRQQEAMAEFRRCVELDPQYLAAYVEGGKCLRSGGEHQAAREMFLAGLELAKQKGDTHMQDFIRQQLETLP